MDCDCDALGSIDSESELDGESDDVGDGVGVRERTSVGVSPGAYHFFVIDLVSERVFVMPSVMVSVSENDVESDSVELPVTDLEALCSFEADNVGSGLNDRCEGESESVGVRLREAVSSCDIVVERDAVSSEEGVGERLRDASIVNDPVRDRESSSVSDCDRVELFDGVSELDDDSDGVGESE